MRLKPDEPCIVCQLRHDCLICNLSKDSPLRTRLYDEPTTLFRPNRSPKPGEPNGKVTRS